jgi:N-acetylated-alpha-linked acidic dipeptidase
MGAGSDYTAFYHHLGIPSVHFGFGGEDDGGIYHSIYDTFRWYTTFSDTAFVYGQALARTVGLATMRLADAELLPFEFNRLSDRVATNLKEVQDLQRTTRDSIEEQNRQVAERPFVPMNYPRHPLVAPTREAVPPFLNFAPLQNGAMRLKSATARFETAYAAFAGAGPDFEAAMLDSLNTLLLEAERAMAPTDGLPRRPWYRQLLSAPGLYTGYAPKTMPGVREAIEDKRGDEAEAQAEVLGRALAAEGELLDRAAALLEQARAKAR